MEVLGGAVAAMQASISAARLSLSGGLIRFAQNNVAGFKISLHVTEKQGQWYNWKCPIKSCYLIAIHSATEVLLEHTASKWLNASRSTA